MDIPASRLEALAASDRQRLERRLHGVRRLRDPKAREAALAKVDAAVEAAEQRLARRRASVPAVSYPEALPVSQKKDDILAAIRDHQVVIVAGETGSGKTTQIPKICLELGRGVLGRIGHTQPRRIAARTVAERVAEELRTPLGAAVGWKVRFTDQVGEDTLVKLMTDGILLAEIQHDRMLTEYDTLIIDEAHERSLNVDFILGYLKQLLPRRPDLKVVITSATIDPERFSRHFDGAPVIEVSGRTYPVEVRYRPLVAQEEDEDDRDQVQGICDAVEELCAEGPGDVLVFLSGEREIRDTADALARLDSLHTRGRQTEILPLYARLSAAEQHRVFQRHGGRRIVLATNVAETSLTVPGIKYVVDPGTARISRYSHRLKVQRLPIEAISQASANQRKGRCGRVSEGICIRLYSEEDFLSRPEFTDPEILRTNLASVILQMTAIGLGDIAAFPFVEPPDRRNIKDGVQLLEELGAIDPSQKDVRRRLTPLGRKLAQLPVDPRLARMVLEAETNGCVHEVMVITAALSIQDPRERPVDKQQAADEKHRRFSATGDGEASDFLAYLNLWQYLREKQRELSSNQFRKLCKAEFLNYLRVREWQDIYSQLRTTVKSLGVTLDDAAPADQQKVHLSLLAGLLSHIGLMDPEKREYLGARGARFAIFPGSALFKKPPRWVMAAELVETSRLWARIAARIEPEWAESLAQHLVKRNYSEPHWEKDRGAVMAYEKVTLYGVPLVAGRKVSYGRIDPELSRELFIRHALVQGEWRTHHRFFHDNRALLEEVEDLEHRARRRDILVDDETLFDFYDERVGKEVVSARHFDSWWKKTKRTQPDLLAFEKSMLINDEAGGVSADDYPDHWVQGELRLRLSYQFEPGTEADGVTVHIPLQVLNQVTAEGFDWQIPGLREDLVTALIRSLPKALRRNLVPAPDVAREALARIGRAETGGEPLTRALARELHRMRGVAVPDDAWDLDRVPDHLRITFRVVDGRQHKVAEDKDLGALKFGLRGRTRAAVSAAGAGMEREGLTSWTFGTLPRTFEEQRDGHTVKGFPALTDEGSSVAIRLFGTEDEQQRAMWAGTRRLLLLGTNSPVKQIQSRLGAQAKLALSHAPHRDTAELFADCVSCAVDKLVDDCGGPAWDEEAFAKLRDHVRSELYAAAADAVVKVANILAVAQRVERRVKGSTSLVLVPALTDIKAQLAALVHPGFATEAGLRRLPDVLRYLKAVEHRLERLPNGPQRDRELMAKVEQMEREYRRLVDALPPGATPGPELRRIRWMIEELRVSYFAQGLGTPYPVSDKRILKAIDQLQG
jgi:ATP-dependent helicase HrpA